MRRYHGTDPGEMMNRAVLAAPKAKAELGCWERVVTQADIKVD
jgi:hypothetical protein